MLNFTHNFLLPPIGARGQGMGVLVSSSHVVSAAPSSSQGGLLTLFLCCSMGPFHRVQFFRKRLPQCRSPVWSQVPTANLLQHGLLSLHRATGAARSLLQYGLPMGSQPPLGHSSSPVWGPPRAARGYLPHCGPPWTAGVQPASPWSSPWDAEKPLLQCLELLLPLFFTNLGVCRVVSHIVSLLFLLQIAITQDFFSS